MTKPTQIQNKVIYPLIRGKDAIIISPTGSGKTLSYLIPLCHYLDFTGFPSLILVPTRELAFQVSQVLKKFQPQIQIVLAVGGTPFEKQKKHLLVGYQVLIATPGRLIEFLEWNNALLRKVKYVVFDEFDKLLNMGFANEVNKIENQLNKKRQLICLSATFSNDISFPKVAKNHLWVNLVSKKTTIEESFYLFKNPKRKGKMCIELINQHREKDTSSILIFVSNRKKANHLQGLLKLNQVSCGMLHGASNNRSQTFQHFIEGNIKVLITTNLLGRGIDTLKVGLVINYDLPNTFEEYIHRKGRTGRLGKSGSYINFAEPSEYLAMKKIKARITLPIVKYGNRDKWMLSARALHKTRVLRTQKLEKLKTQQQN